MQSAYKTLQTPRFFTETLFFFIFLVIETILGTKVHLIYLNGVEIARNRIR